MLVCIEDLAIGGNGHSREKMNTAKNKFSSCRLGNGIIKPFIRCVMKLNKILG